jgi:DNA-directed RNA polymerase specialized sigma24 family protein
MSPPKKKPKKNHKENEEGPEKSAEAPPKTYGEMSSIVDGELSKRKGSWFLSSVAWLDFDDVCQIIRAHIYRKWDQWDQSRPLKPWLNKIIANQFKNILRNHYSNFARPCLNCPFNSDSEYKLCSFTESGSQDTTCPLYAKWNKTKKYAYNVKITLSLEHHSHQIAGGGADPFLAVDLEEAAAKLIKELKLVLNQRQFQAFELLYIQNLTDEEAAKEMGFKSTEAGRKAGYKQIKNLKKLLKEKAEKILKKKGIAFLGEEDEAY